jgi:hypothetical protein
MSTVTHLTIAEYDQMIAAGAFDPRETFGIGLAGR